MSIPLPEAFCRVMREQLGSEAEALFEALEGVHIRALRFGDKKADTEVPGLLSPVPYALNAYELEKDSPAGRSWLHDGGLYYLQEPAAMVPASVLNPAPGESVLDLCAAPGGKSTQLSSLMRSRGLLVCNEVVPRRAQVLSGNLERMGVGHALVTQGRPEKLAQRFPGFFDAVLVDAPCSGEGMFRRQAESRLEWSWDGVRGCQSRQREILSCAVKMVRPGGRLVYSTCTLNHLENEDNVLWLEENFPDFHRESFRLAGEEYPGILTCYPHRFRGEGQFAALLRRGGETEARVPAPLPPPVSREQKQALFSFSPFEGEVMTFGQILVSLPECPPLQGLRVLRCGLHLGQVRNHGFEPDHAWAMSLTPPCLPCVDMCEEEAAAYLRGDVLRERPERGWVLARWKGLPLGLGKCSSGVMKNHYPKGLRRTSGQMDETGLLS